MINEIDDWWNWWSKELMIDEIDDWRLNVISYSKSINLPVDFLCFAPEAYSINEAKKKTDDKVSALPTTPVTWKK